MVEQDLGRRKFLQNLLYGGVSAVATYAICTCNNPLGVSGLDLFSKSKDDSGKGEGKHKGSNPKKFLILDSGHGWRKDGKNITGAETFSGPLGSVMDYVTEGLGGVKEDEVVYDVLCRVLALDKVRADKSKFEVIPIMRDRETGYRPLDILVDNGSEDIFYNGKSFGGACAKNRVSAINSICDDLVKKVDANTDNIYFLSLHANSEPIKNGGAFFLYPSEKLYGGVDVEKKSMEFGSGLLNSLKSKGVRMHGQFSITDLVSGGKGKDIFSSYDGNDRPALDIFNGTFCIDKKIVLEIGNMKNLPADFVNFQIPAYRDSIAKGIIDYMEMVSR